MKDLRVERYIFIRAVLKYPQVMMELTLQGEAVMVLMTKMVIISDPAEAEE